MADRQNRLTRRGFLKRGLVVGAAAAVGLAGRAAYFHVKRDYRPERTEAYLASIQPAQDPAALPNIIIVMADDLGYGDLSLYGESPIRTPALERMAAEGVTLTQFNASAPTCTPSRASLLTGRYAIRSHLALPLFRSGHWMEYFLKLIGRYRYDVSGIPEDEALLPEILKRRGYRTGLVGKWHLGDRGKSLPNACGFDFFYGALYPNDETPFAIYRDGQVEIPAPADQDALTGLYTREAIRFLEINREQPFFLFLSHSAVHEPLFAGAKFRGKSAAGLYGDGVEEIDWSLGQVLGKLSELGLDERTLVMFTSDNGPWWQGDPGGLRGRKNNLLEGGFRVPFVARWPGTLPAGQVRGAASVNFDLFPTCLGLAGAPLPDDRVIDGVDILPALLGEPVTPHETFYYYDGVYLVAVREGKWKYHRRWLADNGAFPLFNHGPFLFDLELDPGEAYDLSETFPEVAERMAGLLEVWEEEMDRDVRGWMGGGRN